MAQIVLHVTCDDVYIVSHGCVGMLMGVGMVKNVDGVGRDSVNAIVCVLRVSAVCLCCCVTCMRAVCVDARVCVMRDGYGDAMMSVYVNDKACVSNCSRRCYLDPSLTSLQSSVELLCR